MTYKWLTGWQLNEQLEKVVLVVLACFFISDAGGETSVCVIDAMQFACQPIIAPLLPFANLERCISQAGKLTRRTFEHTQTDRHTSIDQLVDP